MKFHLFYEIDGINKLDSNLRIDSNLRFIIITETYNILPQNFNSKEIRCTSKNYHITCNAYLYCQSHEK